MNKKILKLENNKEYFLMSELTENDINYLLLINVDNEYDIKICKRIVSDDEDYIVEVEQSDTLTKLKEKFKLLVDKDKNINL